MSKKLNELRPFDLKAAKDGASLCSYRMGGRSMISMDKKYKTRNGLPVRILCLDRKGDMYPVIGLVTIENGAESIHTFTADGRFNFSPEGDSYDLIEVSPYEDLKIDEPVMVRNSGAIDWSRRHFAGVAANGKVLCWDSGCTSFTAGESFGWDEGRRPTPEELAGK